jgi:hypothetical protein
MLNVLEVSYLDRNRICGFYRKDTTKWPVLPTLTGVTPSYGFYFRKFFSVLIYEARGKIIFLCTC